jgi:hypothetical protein
LCYCFLDWQHINTVYWTGLDTQITASALVGYHRMHKFCRTQNSVDWAGLNTFGATDTFILTNKGDSFDLCFFTVLGIQFWRWYIQKVGYSIDSCLATGWAFINRIAIGD